ncbi:MAG: DUF2306 domain-containing protein [Pseudomonadota bacterium]
MHVIPEQATTAAPAEGFQRSMQWSARLLVATVWVSALIFGCYIFVFYFLSSMRGDITQWNDVLPDLYSDDAPAATIGIGAHFAAGSVILMLGCIQLIGGIRAKYPTVHRWLGRVYVVSALITGVGGLVFISTKGTVGGLMMDIGFTGYGVLTIMAALATIHFARRRDFVRHRAWAIRLFALAVGSWLYRMEYGFWFLFTDGLGHTTTFDGPFDQVMDFFFYLPNLLIAEVMIGRRKIATSRVAQGVATGGLLTASVLLLLATYFFTLKLWGPEIVGGLLA